jgi:hypothetical protein
MEVRQARFSLRPLIVRIPLVQRGLHNINDELTFNNHAGYVFHDSRGFEAGAEDELKIVQEFVRRKSQEKKLNDRLHAIWFVPSGTYTSKFPRLLLQVLHSDGQRSAISGFKAFWRCLPG